MDKDAICKVKYDDYNYKERMLLMYTDKCTANCLHCAAESSTSNNTKMSMDEAKKYLQVAAAKNFKCILWSGGEVFIYFNEILKLTEYGKSLGLVFTIDTNAFWAQSEEVAYGKLKLLKEAGVIHIDVSCDAFHMKFVPVKNIITAVKAALDLGISSRVSFTYSGDKEVDHMLLSILKEQEVPFVESEMAKVGFAKKLPDELFGSIEIADLMGCEELGPLVRTDGSIIGCCNPTVSKESPVHIGLGKDNFEDKIDNYLNSKCINLLANLGFRKLYNLLKEDKTFEPYKKKKYSHNCEFCFDLFNDKELYQRTMDYIEKYEGV